MHATTAQRAGEPAAIEILGWTNGSFQTCDRPWPEQPTIATPHEGLILRVAQARDEGQGSNLVAFPARSAAAPDEDVFEELELSEIAEEGEGEMRGSNIDEAVPTPKPGSQSGRTEMAGDFSVVMRLAPNGAIISNRGGARDLADTIAYVDRLLQLTGELLGLGPFSALECSFTPEGRCFIFSDGSGETVALRPRSEASLQPLREKLGL